MRMRSVAWSHPSDDSVVPTVTLPFRPPRTKTLAIVLTTTTYPLPRMKLDVPRFNGSDPSGWMFKINQFFAYHSTPEPDRLTIVAFAMEGPALAWFQWMSRSGQISSWLGFLQALEGRFATSQYEDPTGILSKLTQTGTVTAYLSQFETLANRTIGLPNSFLLSCFISGLIPEIRREVQVSQPLTLTHVAALAHLYEEKLADQHNSNRGRFNAPAPPRSTLVPSTFVAPPMVPALLPPSAKPPPPPLKRLSPEEMAIRREKGLCFNCEGEVPSQQPTPPSILSNYVLIICNIKNCSNYFTRYDIMNYLTFTYYLFSHLMATKTG